MKRNYQPVARRSKLKTLQAYKIVAPADRAPSLNLSDPERRAHAVVQALENPKYKWRTIDGIARETGVDRASVQRVLDRLGEGIVRANVASTSGDSLFTTRRSYRQKESLISRFGAVLRNRAA